MGYQLCGVYAQGISDELPPLLAQVHGTSTVRIDHHGREPLYQQRLTVAESGRGQARPCVRVGIDEARRHVQACGVDLTLPRGCPEISHRHDSVSVEGHVGPEPRVARSVDHPPVSYDDVIALSGCHRRSRQGQREC